MRGVWICILMIAASGFVHAGESLLDFAEKGNVTAVKKALAAGADVNMTSPQGQTALMIAAFQNDTATLKILLQAGANVEAGDNINGATALCYAAHSGAFDTGKLLIAARANLNVRTSDGLTPLILTTSRERSLPQHEVMAELLIQAGAIVSRSGRGGNTPLMHATSNGMLRIVELLVANGAPVDAINDRGETALMFAKAYNQKEIESFLTERSPAAKVAQCRAKAAKLRQQCGYCGGKGHVTNYNAGTGGRWETHKNLAGNNEDRWKKGQDSSYSTGNCPVCFGKGAVAPQIEGCDPRDLQ